jgi:hypothetical protein
MFVVSGTNNTGTVSNSVGTAVTAVQRATEMMGLGFSGVTIKAPDGRVYGHAEFHLLVGVKR